MTLPSMLVVLATIIFLVMERAFPGRELLAFEDVYHEESA